MVINTADGQVTRQSLSHRCCEFPTIPASRNGKQAKYLYAPAAAVEDVYNWGPNQVCPLCNASSSVFSAVYSHKEPTLHDEPVLVACKPVLT